MSIPDYQTLMLPLLRMASQQETRVLDAENQIADDFQLSQAEREQLLPNGRQRLLHNRIHWAKFYLSKANLISSPRRGVFALTDLGRDLLEKNPSKIDLTLLRSYPAFEQFYRGGSDITESGLNLENVSLTTSITKTPEEQVEAAFLALQSALRAQIIERILQNSPSFFEGLIVDLLVKMGYGGSHQNAAAQLGRTGDGGVDGVINEDRLGLDRVYIQAKRYSEGNSVGRPDVQSFVGSLVGYGATKGVFVTTSTFSNHAIEFAKHLTQRVILIDGYQLAELMIEHNVGVRLNRALEFKRIDEDFFSEEN